MSERVKPLTYRCKIVTRINKGLLHGSRGHEDFSSETKYETNV